MANISPWTSRCRRGSMTAIVVGLALLVGACTADDVPAAPVDDAELVQGQAVYTSNCANCHGPAGGGALGTKLNGGEVLERMPEADDQVALILEGRNQMPGFDGKLSEAEIDAVVRYTREVIATQ
jgi:cytochrome c oxidase subunit 2